MLIKFAAVTAIALVASYATLSSADSQFKKGASQITLDVEGLSLVPAMGLDDVPLIELPAEFLSRPNFLNTIATSIPRDEELIALIGFTEQDFFTKARETASELRSGLSPAQRATTNQRRGWSVINRNLRERVIFKIKVHTSYLPLDFAVITSNGEGGDRRASCVVGFRQGLELEIVDVVYPNTPSLEREAKLVKGTRLKSSQTLFGPAVTLLRAIDLNREKGIAFNRECKAQREKFN